MAAILLAWIASLIEAMTASFRHSRESGNPDIARQRNLFALLCNAARCVWIPAFAGMTGIVKLGARLMAVVALFFVATLATSANAEEQKEYGMVCENVSSTGGGYQIDAYLPGLESAREVEPYGLYITDSKRFADFVQGVNTMLKEGWQPQGGLAPGAGGALCQAIVRKK